MDKPHSTLQTSYRMRILLHCSSSHHQLDRWPGRFGFASSAQYIVYIDTDCVVLTASPLPLYVCTSITLCPL